MYTQCGIFNLSRVKDTQRLYQNIYGWLVGCFWFNGLLRLYFSLYRAVSQREGDRGEKGQMRVKMSKQPPPAPTASAGGPCPTIIQIVGRPSTGSLPRAIAPPDHPLSEWIDPTSSKRKSRFSYKNKYVYTLNNLAYIVNKQFYKSINLRKVRKSSAVRYFTLPQCGAVRYKVLVMALLHLHTKPSLVSPTEVKT